MTFTSNLNPTKDESNSTTTALIGSDVFTGDSKSTVNYTSVQVSIISNVQSAPDGVVVSFDGNMNYSFSYDTPGVLMTRTFNVINTFYNVTYTNGATAQISFVLTSYLLSSISNVTTIPDIEVNSNLQLIETNTDNTATNTGSLVTNTGTTNTKLDSVINNTGAMDTKLDSIETNTSNTNASIEELNTNLNVLTSAVDNASLPTNVQLTSLLDFDLRNQATEYFQNIYNNGTITRNIIDGITLGVPAGSINSATISSNKNIKVSNNRTTELSFTGILTSDTDNTSLTSRIGLFDNSNGVYFNYDTDGLSIRILYSGSQISVLQSNFTIDKFNGSEPSGITLDVQKRNEFIIRIFPNQTIIAGFRFNGKFWPATVFSSNDHNFPNNLNLPISAYIYSNSSMGSMTLTAASASSWGPPIISPNNYSITVDNVTVNNTETFILSFRKTQLNNFINVTGFSIFTVDDIAVKLNFYKRNGADADGTYAYLLSTNNTIQYSTTETLVNLTNSRLIGTKYFYGNSQNEKLNYENIISKTYLSGGSAINDIFYVTAQVIGTSPTSGNVYFTLDIEEY